MFFDKSLSSKWYISKKIVCRGTLYFYETSYEVLKIQKNVLSIRQNSAVNEI